MSAVMSAQHIHLGEAIAVKFLHPRLAMDTVSVERFVREARATSRIKSEHVVRVLDVGATENGLPFIAMELLEGEDLGQTSATAPLTMMLAVDCVLQAADALAEAHAAGVVHRDIKPSNLWLARRRDGSPLVKVLDFGISKLVSTDGVVDRRLTETHTTFGSPTYMSPEQIRSAKNVDSKADVWALGVVLHELLTCQMPFDAPTVPGVLASIIADEPVRLRAVRPDAPAGLEAAILRCLEKDPMKRASLAELAFDLRPFASKLGEISCDRIAGGRTPASMPAPSNGGSAKRDLAFGTTEASLATTRLVAERVRSPGMRLGMGLGIVAIVSTSIVGARFTLFNTKNVGVLEPVQVPPRAAVALEPPPEAAGPEPSAAPSATTGSKPSIDPHPSPRRPGIKSHATAVTGGAVTATGGPAVATGVTAVATEGAAGPPLTAPPLSTTGRQ
jgi:serine/threonine-protein kinase